MTPILIGSRALAHWNTTFQLKSLADWDVISESPIEGCEFHSVAHLNNSKMLQYASNDCIELPNGEYANVISLKGLAIIKRSHLWRSLGFEKHITMYVKHIKPFVMNFDSFDQDVLDERIKLTMQTYPQPKPSLNKSKEEFFDDYVTKKYDHDFLHSLFAYYDAPLYTRLLRDDKTVWCEKSKWDLLSYSDKLKTVAEETYVISAERFLIPKEWKYSTRLAYLKSLEKVCTTLCSGYFRDFAIDNYVEITKLYDEEKFRSFQVELSKYPLTKEHHQQYEEIIKKYAD